MKLFPKNAKFCPGCPTKDLKLNSAPELVIKLENQQDNKIYTLKGIKNSLITEKDGRKGLVDHIGQEIVENKYDEIKSLGEDTKLYIVKSNNKYGISGILDCKYEDIKLMVL